MPHFAYARLRCALAFAVAVCLAAALSAQDFTAEVRRQLDRLRDVQAETDQARLKELNQRMDEVWTYLRKNRLAALPIVASELERAQQQSSTDMFLVLDLAHFLVLERHPRAIELGIASLELLDPAAGVVRANSDELFDLCVGLGTMATDGASERYLFALDRLFLSRAEPMARFRAPHWIRLSPEQVCAILYGLVGDAGAAHLARHISGGPHVPRALEVLVLIGSEIETPAVAAVLNGANDYGTFSRCVTVLMTVGGPAGRSAVLGVDVTKKDEESQKYWQKIHARAQDVAFAGQVRMLRQLDDRSVSDEKVRELLDKMEVANGVDSETPPAAILTCTLATGDLIAQLKRIRARSFRRATQEVFEELSITNAVINGLQFKQAEQAGAKR